MPEANEPETPQRAQGAEFEQLARAAGRAASNPLVEFWYFLGRSRKWWMAPIVLMLLLVGTLLVMAGTAVGPFIYALF
jgi:hypothetical protein